MNDYNPIPVGRIAAVVRAALEEDAAATDATAAFVGLSDAPVVAEIRVSAPTTASGIDVAREVFRQVNAQVEFDARAQDGESLAPDAVLAAISGSARSIVSAERTALNFLQRMCGIATRTAQFVSAVEGTGVVILDTRKTTPLWRDLEKYAVRCGGAQNHRRDLGAMVLIKDNHVRAAGGREALLRRIAEAPEAPFVELEVDSLEFLRALLQSPAAGRVSRVMFDNFTPVTLAEGLSDVAAYRRAHAGRRLEVEVSGGITLGTVRTFALPGVDYISVGALTHSAPAAPMSLEVL